MSDQTENIEENGEKQDDYDIYTDESAKDTMTFQTNTAKVDINAWRKRNSFAFIRNPLNRRMSRGEQPVKKSLTGTAYHPCIRLCQGVALCL